MKPQQDLNFKTDFSSYDLDEVREFVAIRAGDHSRTLQNGTEFHWSVEAGGTNALSCSSSTVTGAQIIRATSPCSTVSVHLPIDLSADYRIGRRNLTTSPNQLLVLPPSHTYTLRTPGGTGVSIALDAEMLLSEIDEIWPGRRGHSAPIACEIKLSRDEVYKLLSVRNVLLSAMDDSADPQKRDTTRALEQDITAWLAAAIVRQMGVKPLSPRRRNRVASLEKWIDNHLSEPIDLEVLTAITGVRAHALAKATSAARGMSPMRLVLTRRLERARKILKESKEEAVTDIAHRCGFSHLGRFAAEYHAAYGEKPSQTSAKKIAS